jgi:hypothetical protein
MRTTTSPSSPHPQQIPLPSHTHNVVHAPPLFIFRQCQCLRAQSRPYFTRVFTTKKVRATAYLHTLLTSLTCPGSRVLHQVPPNSITKPKRRKDDQDGPPDPDPLFNFLSVTQNLIPNQQFCDRLLTFCVNHHRVIGYPVCIKGDKYSRNEFIFNFAIVLGENEPDWACYGEVVRKLGRLLRGLEEQGEFLSREEDGIWEDDGREGLGISGDDVEGVGEFGIGGGSKVYALAEMVLEDLNNYAECMIPIGTFLLYAHKH